jgi:aspartyl-tRNA(Asn)/glutamyl-tRNA(Gln) amidotransferase subunit A
MVVGALGSDTGGSIRQPAAYCSVVGLKPTYGLVSRFGLVAFASSLDQIGPFTKDVRDAAIMLDVIAGHDDMDSTSMNIEKKDYLNLLNKDIKKMKIGVPTEFLSEGLNEEIRKAFEESIDKFEKLGAQVSKIKLDYIKYALAAYYIISPAEASSNLARFDGIKYGYRTDKFDNLVDIYACSRTEGFGDEVKRRIMLGTYVLSSGYYDAYYKRAGQVRTLIAEEFKKQFEDIDIIAIPTIPNTAFKFGEKTSSPLEMYLEDIYTVPVNIAGLPAISIPGGFDSNGLPIGLQLISKPFNEEVLLNCAYAFEQDTKFHKMKPSFKGGNE